MSSEVFEFLHGHVAKYRFQAHNRKQRHGLLQFSSYEPSVNFIFYCTSSKPNTNSETWPQCFKPKLDCSLLGTGSVAVACLHQLSRFHHSVFCAFVQSLQGNYWQDLLKAVIFQMAGNTQELVSPTMCSCWSLDSEHLALRWHGAAAGLAELKWVKALLAEEEKLQVPRTQKANALIRGKSLASRPVQTRPEVWLLGTVSCNQRGEMWGLRGWILIGCGANLKFKAYSCEREKEWKVNRLHSVVCRAAFDERRQSAAAQWQGDLPRQRSSQGWHTIQLSTCWKVH